MLLPQEVKKKVGAPDDRASKPTSIEALINASQLFILQTHHLLRCGQIPLHSFVEFLSIASTTRCRTGRLPV
jgi:hypothetical protein